MLLWVARVYSWGKYATLRPKNTEKEGAMIERFTREEMGYIWSPEQKFTNWARVEIAVLRARVARGELKVEVPEDLENSIHIITKEIDRIEAEKTHHDVKAFLEHTEEQLPEKLRSYWHDRLTSYDPHDTGLSLQIGASIELLQSGLKAMMTNIKRLALEHKYTPQVGRTHMVHAEPITFGVALANWYDECTRHEERLIDIAKRTRVGKISGAVGMYTLDPAIEAEVCKSLGLEPIIATQIISRDIIADYLQTNALIAGTLQKIADNIRQMQSTEVGEVAEYFEPGSTGSSAMPHKQNPQYSENVSGLVEVIRAYATAGLALQRDLYQRVLCNSGPERIILPDSSILLDFILARMTGVLDTLIVYPERMLQNLDITKGLIYSQNVQALIAEKSGLPREKAYALVRTVVDESLTPAGISFVDQLTISPPIREHVDEKEILECFELKRMLKHVDYIFERVFGPSSD